MRRLGILRAGLAGLAAVSTVAAQAADTPANCLSEEEIAALTVYVMPQLITAAQAGCKAYLAKDGFLAIDGTAMAQRYTAKADTVWQQAKSAFMKFGGDNKSKKSEDFANLSDAALRPLVSGLIEQEVAKDIQPKSCHDIERLAKVLNQLEPDTTGALVSVIASLAIGNKKKPNVCEA